MGNLDPKLGLVYSVFKTVASRFPKQWICDERWYQFITAHTPELLNPNVTRPNLVWAITSKSPPGIGEFAEGTHQSGIFMKHFKMKCPVNNKRREVYFYYVTDPGDYAPMPQHNAADFVRKNPQNHSWSTNEDISTPGGSTTSTNEEDTGGTNEEDTGGTTTNDTNMAIDDADESSEPANKRPTFATDFWQRVKARNLFAPGSSSSVKEILQERITILGNVSNDVEGSIAGGQLNLTSDLSLSREKEQNNYSMMLFGKVWLFFPNWLTVRKCARRARQYIQAYYVIEVLKQGDGGENGIDKVTLPMIEKLTKDFKTHRSAAIDFDGKFKKDLLN
jgi:hypothetical protein